MEKIKLIAAYNFEDPTKEFVVCDMDEGMEFLDPLTMFSIPAHDPYKINSQGLYAVGGKINSSTLFSAYKWGIFPWYSYKLYQEPYWYCPEKRYVIFPNKIHVSHSLRTLLNKGRYHITINQAFELVIHHCRTVQKREEHEGAWLSDEIEESFIQLHKRGYAKSVEVWEEDKLVGGYYGFFYKGAFEGDSMFSLRPSASQIGLILLCRNPFIDGQKIKFIDTQFETPTFKKLGGEYISYQDYRRIMDYKPEE